MRSRQEVDIFINYKNVQNAICVGQINFAQLTLKKSYKFTHVFKKSIRSIWILIFFVIVGGAYFDKRSLQKLSGWVRRVARILLGFQLLSSKRTSNISFSNFQRGCFCWADDAVNYSQTPKKTFSRSWPPYPLFICCTTTRLSWSN